MGTEKFKKFPVQVFHSFWVTCAIHVPKLNLSQEEMTFLTFIESSVMSILSEQDVILVGWLLPGRSCIIQAGDFDYSWHHTREKTKDVCVLWTITVTVVTNWQGFQAKMIGILVSDLWSTNSWKMDYIFCI